jgi:uncharacterized protein
MMQAIQSNPFKLIKAREVVYAYLVVMIMSTFTLRGLTSLTGIDPADPFWTPIGYGLTIVPLAGWLLWRLRSVGADLPAFFGKLPKRMRWGRMFGLTIATLLTSVGLFLLLGYLWYSLNPDSVRSFIARLLKLQSMMRPGTSVMPDLTRVLLLFTVIIAAPLCEELIFRGILLQRWTTKWNAPIALILTSALFGILHVNFIGAGTIGLVAGVLYYQTKSLWAPVALHAMNNTIAGLSLAISPDVKRSMTVSEYEKIFSQGGVAVFCLVIATPWVIRFIGKNWPRKDAPTPYQANQMARTTVAD